ncbi:MAG: hypothetical protein KDC87_02520, partial [Planctomycetes bacterium]|nr:hypothetical protein [Planctomycetota bacterium]
MLLVGGVPAAAQRGSEFAARVRTATTAADPLALQALAREPADFAARVDAIAAAEPLAPWQRARAIDTLLPAAERQRLLATLWIAEPSARRSRAPVFANLGAAWMIERYAKAEAGERHDLRTVVNFPPVGLHADLRAAIRGSGDRAAVRDAAVALLRASTVHRAAHRDEAIEALRAVDDARARERVRGAFGQTVVTRVPPERLASLLPSRDLRVVARAVFVLRRVLGLPDRPEVLAALADDPEPSLARHGAGTWTQARIERELPTLVRGTRSPLFCALSEGKAVPSPTNLARIRARLIRVGL